MLTKLGNKKSAGVCIRLISNHTSYAHTMLYYFELVRVCCKCTL